MRTLCHLLILTIAACAGLCSCNKPAGGNTATGAGNGATGAAPSANTTASAEPEVIQPAPSDVPPVNTDTTGKPLGAGTVSGDVAPIDLSGKWIALFGRTPGGSVVEAWKTGDAIEFRRAGELIWTKQANAETMAYTLNGLQIALKPSAPGKMNVGRDDEVGLMNVGRDDEIGLNKSKPQAAAKKEATNSSLQKTIFRDGNYLALTGKDNDVMVFAKLADNPPATHPEVAGNFTGMVPGRESVPAAFVWKENMLQGNLDEGKGQFKGEYKNGYFIGVTSGSTGNGLAALTVMPDGSLQGVTLALPFNRMNADFDFKPGQ